MKKEIKTWTDIIEFMNETCSVCGEFLNNSPDCEERCVTLEGLKPLFTSSDTGNCVYLLDGEPQYLEYRLDGDIVRVTIPQMLEIYKIFNGIWYSGLWRMLDVCTSGFCPTGPPGHLRTKDCPQMTEYERRVYNEYLRNMRDMHMEENRPPIANSETSDNSQPI